MIWRSLVGFPGYAVSSAGTVRRGRAPVPPQPHRGYARVRLRSPSGRRVWRKVHLLVLEAFVGPRPSPRHHGAHYPDPDPTNNRARNLRWALPEENEAHKRARAQIWVGGARQPTPPARVVAIRAAAARGASFTALGRSYGLHRTSVARIVRGLRRAS